MRKTYLAAILAGLTLSGAALAQQTATEAPTPAAATTQQSAVDLSDANLLKFSVAMDSIQKVGAEYESKFQAAETPEQAQQVQQEAQAEMVKAVEAAGLTADEYNAIAQQAQQDEALRNKILAMAKTPASNKG
ncbi:flagellar basal body P-ring protein FlgI [Rheinheimera pacifica]|uniref:DUF4168 domain-containing protein n=1 Tax=Rheinheimera pacifica TaxID=173990 RepID=UPI000CABBA4A|nr:DUF4168 domain-containing protein [Rheinheimera pacifica]MDR6984998.1 flagellar basal body P-ring protein FlgI [Rheinheimera pacifica]PKM18091.1 MAG: hypothetical protein CVV11_18540 [Gammaproteobacteria bacterium HGW-Gammaproteobacteria-15]